MQGMRATWSSADQAKQYYFGYPRSEVNPKGEPLPTQKRFHKSKKRYRLLAGGFGTGKTTSLCIEMVKDIAIPFNYIMAGRKDLGEFINTTLQELLSLVPAEMIIQHDKSRHIIEFVNGTKLLYMNLDDGRAAVERIKSLNLGAAYIDQLEEIDEQVFLALMGRLRRKGTRRVFCATANPAGHDWLWRSWKETDYQTYCDSLGITVNSGNEICEDVNRKLEEMISHPQLCAKISNPLLEACKGYAYDVETVKTLVNKYEFELFESITLENKYLPPDYIAGLLQYPERWVKRFVYCSWDDFEGIVYNECVEARHKITGIYFPSPHDKHYIFLDYGFRNPTAALFISINYDGKATIWGEYYASGKLISEIVKEIKAANPYFSKALKYADPSIWNVESNAKSKAEEFESNGMFLLKANNDVLQGIDRVNQLFKDDMIQITANCVNFWREIGNYKWKEIKPGQNRNDYEEPVKKDDHAMDALRYFANYNYAPVKPKEPVPIKQPGMDGGRKDTGIGRALGSITRF